MVNIDKLKGKMVEKKKTYKDGAAALNVSIATFSNKMNGKGCFYVHEVLKLSKLLDLTNQEKVDIFLS